jgi:mRNA interferase RelE/StbE
VSRPGCRWQLDVRPRAQRALTRLPEKIAAAAAEFITGPLLDNPYRVGHSLRDGHGPAGGSSAIRYPISQSRSIASVLIMRFYAMCIDGQDKAARRRIEEALRDHESG